MAIGTPVSLGSAAASGASVATVTMTTIATVTAGSGEAILVHGFIASTTNAPVSVTDSVGNTYVIDVQLAANSGQTHTDFIASCLNPASTLASGGTITATFTTPNTGLKTIGAMKTSGLLTSAAKDKTATNSASSAAWTGGSTGTLAQADELVLYAVSNRTDATANTPDAGWTDILDFATGSRRLAFGYQIVAATTAVNPSGTMGNNSWAAVVATYKAAASSANFTQTLAVTNSPATTRAAAVTAVKPTTATPTAARSLAVSVVKPVALTPTVARMAGAAAIRTVTATSTVSLARTASATRAATTTATALTTRRISAARNADVETTATRVAALGAGRSVEVLSEGLLSKGVAPGGRVADVMSSAVRTAITGQVVAVSVAPTASLARSIAVVRRATNTVTATTGRGVAAALSAIVTSGAARAGAIVRQAVRYRLMPGTRTPQSTLEPATGAAHSLTASTRPQHTLEAE